MADTEGNKGDTMLGGAPKPTQGGYQARRAQGLGGEAKPDIRRTHAGQGLGARPRGHEADTRWTHGEAATVDTTLKWRTHVKQLWRRGESGHKADT